MIGGIGTCHLSPPPTLLDHWLSYQPKKFDMKSSHQSFVGFAFIKSFKLNLWGWMAYILLSCMVNIIHRSWVWPNYWRCHQTFHIFLFQNDFYTFLCIITSIKACKGYHHTELFIKSYRIMWLYWNIRFIEFISRLKTENVERWVVHNPQTVTSIVSPTKI